jgi:CO/xanthine dehydrogenase FAD-binding subunit
MSPPEDVLSEDRNLYYRPKSLEQAVVHLAMPGVQVLSGGTDFYPALGDRIVQTPVMDISGLRELRGISVESEFLRIGGLTTWTDILRASLPPCGDALKSAAREVGSVQIQSRGTVAGNLCNASPAADGVPPLLALDAELELTSYTGSRRMPLAEFLIGNRKTLRRADELLTAVWLPRRIEDARSSFLKLGARRYLVISISMVAAVMLVESGHVVAARVAVGSCSAVARRLSSFESSLIGAPIRDGMSAFVLPEHLTSLSPIDDVRATADYRLDASLTLVRRAIDSCLEAA